MNQQNNEELSTIITVNNKITFIASSEKQKIDDNVNESKKLSSIISRLEFVEEI